MQTVERTTKNVLTIRHKEIRAGWSQRYLLISDVHFDSPHCDRRLLTKHLDQAKDANAGVICVGDWFDAMGGKADKRGSKETIRAEDRKNAYFNSLVDNSVDYLWKYQSILAAFLDGNHETAIVKHNENDILETMVQRLRADRLTGDKKQDAAILERGLQHMGYSCFVRLMFDSKGHRHTLKMHCHHGSGGGGPVTQDKIGNNRKLVDVSADIYVQGHIHVVGYSENRRLVCSDSGRESHRTEYLVTCPGYKQEYTMEGGFHVERGRSARPNGGWWLDLFYDGDAPGYIGVRFLRAC